jgi:heme oxygenase
MLQVDDRIGQVGRGAPQNMSDQLRLGTTRLHKQAEELLALPGAIRDRHDYGSWLARFYGLYEPLEHGLTAFSEWGTFGIPLPTPSHSALLARDIMTLGADPDKIPRAAFAILPELPTFAHALGALYVLEGATLGGKIILRDLRVRIGDPIDQASLFFGGRRDAAGPMWLCFRTALDGFGRAQPQSRDDVVAGAVSCFQAILSWFAPFRAGAAILP